MASDADYQYKKIKANDFNHASGDKQKATAYDVSVDGEAIGTVYTRSSQSWLKTKTGVRYHFSGYSRSWSATAPDGQEFRYNNSRADAAARLAQHKGE